MDHNGDKFHNWFLKPVVFANDISGPIWFVVDVVSAGGAISLTVARHPDGKTAIAGQAEVIPLNFKRIAKRYATRHDGFAVADQVLNAAAKRRVKLQDRARGTHNLLTHKGGKRWPGKKWQKHR
ncbi:hypothetical protein UFOVP142_49 [uncultured Caudovirales phage]|uniref:Uncharacterized protein n=1 Tax=uncultured Caudovirales phage TaxID=2100421 RepID=A0A6J7XUH7_9CAUD|nr:hypothetical protein UFOVP142_49 [uncultured Caudovirales phage]